jgi:hypothetical protein
MPPIMSDGRNYSTWQPESIINQDLQQKSGLSSNWEYRRYLQKNANDIMKYNQMDTVQSSGNYSINYNNGTNNKNNNNNNNNNSPFIFTSTHDKSIPSYAYNNSDLKQNYLSREQLNARLISPSIPTNNF